MSQKHVAEAAPVSAAQEVSLPAPSTRKRGAARHMHRFRLGVIALLALAVASLGVAVALSSTGRVSTGSGDWSAWSPSDGGLTGAQEIADFVAPYYRATPAQQLAVVTTVNLNDPNHPLQVVVPASGSSGSLVPLPANSTIVYNLCGEGSTDCAIGAGQPSAARLLLLKREAVELALYTFKYISGSKSVVAILPPGRSGGCVGLCPKPASSQKPTRVQLALAFDHSELQPWLDHPLHYALPEQIPPTVSQMQRAPEAELVSIITAHGLFQEKSEQAQDGSSVVVLSPIPPQ
jgi:hypothetical protein